MITIYQFQHSVDSNEIGYYPQIEEDWKNTKYWGPTSIINTPLEGPITYKPSSPIFNLRKMAKLTDKISSVADSCKMIMIRERLFRLFTEFSLDACQCFEEYVNTPTGEVPYRLLYLPYPRDDEFFNWEHCLFYDFHDPEKKIFSVADAREYYKAHNGKILKPERLVLRDGQPAFDLFRCRFYDGGTRFYVSSRLKQAMEAAGITGVRFEAIPCLEANDLETM
jgi:hypothetical protein